MSCSASYKGALEEPLVRPAVRGEHKVHKLFSKGQRKFYADHAPEGLEIDEKIVIGVHTPKARDWERANRVTVRDDLRMQLDEVLHKLKEHTGRLVAYDGWRQMLAANPEARLSLDIADWLYFFGAPA